MFETAALATFFGWCTVINFAIYALTAFVLLIMRKPVIELHSGLSGVPPDRLPELYFKYLSNYKVAIFMLNLVPYLALRVML